MPDMTIVTAAGLAMILFLMILFSLLFFYLSVVMPYAARRARYHAAKMLEAMRSLEDVDA